MFSCCVLSDWVHWRLATLSLSLCLTYNSERREPVMWCWKLRVITDDGGCGDDDIRRSWWLYPVAQGQAKGWEYSAEQDDSYSCLALHRASFQVKGKRGRRRRREKTNNKSLIESIESPKNQSSTWELENASSLTKGWLGESSVSFLSSSFSSFLLRSSESRKTSVGRLIEMMCQALSIGDDDRSRVSGLKRWEYSIISFQLSVRPSVSLLLPLH